MRRDGSGGKRKEHADLLHVSASVGPCGDPVNDARHLRLTQKQKTLSFRASNARKSKSDSNSKSNSKLPSVPENAPVAPVLSEHAEIQINSAQHQEKNCSNSLLVSAKESNYSNTEGSNTESNTRDNEMSVLESEEDMELHGSGVFFALKLQTAKNQKMYQAFLKEVDHMHNFIGFNRVLQMKDSECCPRELRVVILLELAKCDLDSFLRKQCHLLDAGGICRIFRCMVEAVAEVHR